MRYLLLALLLVLVAPLCAAERAEDGVWWNPDASGTGFQIEHQGDLYMLAFYLYDPDGRQLWLTSSASWDASVGEDNGIGRLRGSLWRYADGQCLACAWRMPVAAMHAAGDFELEFQAADRATLHWGGASMPVQRIAYAWADRLARFEGRWLLTERNGELPGATVALRAEVAADGASATLRDAGGATIATLRRDGFGLIYQSVSADLPLPLVVAERDRFVASDGNQRSVVGVRTDDIALDGDLAPPAGAWGVRIDAALAEGAMKRLLGVNKGPRQGGRNAPGYDYDSSALYRAFGVQSVRLHDVGVDLCDIYDDARIENLVTQPPTPLTTCVNTPNGAAPRVAWTVRDPALVDTTARYDFSAMDTQVASVLAVGARIYLRLGESFNGPNDSGDVASWAAVAGNVYRHLIGGFAANAAATADPEYVEVHNEPDGMFWNGDDADFYALFGQSVDHVRAHAATAMHPVRIGGPGFTRNVLRGMATPGSLTQGFVGTVGPSRLGFYSAHYYGDCAVTTLPQLRDWLRTLRGQLALQGLADTPLHISEWNIGLGQACGDAIFDTPRLASFVASALVLMHEDAFAIEAAHYYAGTTVMSLFKVDDGNPAIDIRPGAWGFWGFHELAAGTRLASETCAQSQCGNFGDHPDAPAVLAARVAGGGLRLLVANDSASARSLAVQVRNIEAVTTARVRTAPSQATRRVETRVSGQTVAVTDAGAAAALAAVTETTLPVRREGERSLAFDLELAPYAVVVVDLM